MIEEPSYCVNCHEKFYPKADRGSVACRFHPLPLNEDCDGEKYARFHFECCGACPFKDDLEHFEHTTPLGCVPIDHITDAELHRIYIKTPYFCTLVKDANNLKITRTPYLLEDQRVVLISEHSQLEKNIFFKTFDGNTLTLNPKALLDKMSEVGEQPQLSSSSSKKSSYYTYAKEGRGAVKESTFEPFYIIARVGSSQSRQKLREVNHGRGDCKYRETKKQPPYRC